MALAETKICMVNAVISAIGSDENRQLLLAEREVQMELGDGILNPEKEAGNLVALFSIAGVPSVVDSLSSSTILEIQEILRKNDENDIFLGFKKGPDYSPHIIHISEVLPDGFRSKQQFLSNEEIVVELMQQSEVQVFIRRDSGK